MKKDFSKKWASSTQPRKQRKYRINAPLHTRHKLMSCALDKKLREEFKRRSFPVRKGDKVLIMRGQFKKVVGEVTKKDTSSLKIYIDSAKRKNTAGKEIQVPVDPSNVKIIDLKRDDKKRMEALRK